MKNILILSSMLMFMFGCGSGGGSSTPDTPGDIPEKGENDMEINKLYVVSSGDQIIKTSSVAKVKIIHNDGSSQSTAILLVGSATLINN